MGTIGAGEDLRQVSHGGRDVPHTGQGTRGRPGELPRGERSMRFGRISYLVDRRRIFGGALGVPSVCEIAVLEVRHL